jgi:predicted HicB family RNase H-like nuclease
MSKTAHYQKIVYWSDEDQCFIGRCPALFLGGVHGDDEAKVYAELCAAVEEHLALLRQDGEAAPAADGGSYTGKLTVRIAPDLHRTLAARAAAEGDSLNHTIERTLALGLSR